MDTPVFFSPMYDNLETNIPHTMMTYSTDHSLADNQLFPRRDKVLEYLESYANEVLHLIKFETGVTSVTLKRNHGKDQWTITSINLMTSVSKRRPYDAIVVASGHYKVPYIPAIPGLKEWNTTYPDRISHSKYYRNPKPYTASKTLLIGASASGLDISTQVATTCAKPLLLSQRTQSDLAAGFPDTGILVVPEVAEFLPPSSGHERAVRFVDGQIESGIEKVLFCTGYLHSYPFLSLLDPPPITNGERVEHLYQHIFYTPNPTLGFVGVPSKILPFPTCEAQAAVIARVWSDRLPLPPRSDMEAWEADRMRQKGSGKKFHELTVPEDLDYLNNLVDWAEQASEREGVKDMLPRKWNEHDYWVRRNFPAIKKAFANRGEERWKVRHIEDLDFEYRDRNGEERSVDKPISNENAIADRMRIDFLTSTE